MEKQLAETTGLFRGKERKALQEKISGVQQEIDRRMDLLPGILKEDGYPDVQAFKRTYDDATALVEQYNRDLVRSRSVRTRSMTALSWVPNRVCSTWFCTSSPSVPSISAREISFPSLSVPMGSLRETSPADFFSARRLIRISFAILT